MSKTSMRYSAICYANNLYKVKEVRISVFVSSVKPEAL